MTNQIITQTQIRIEKNDKITISKCPNCRNETRIRIRKKGILICMFCKD